MDDFGTKDNAGTVKRAYVDMINIAKDGLLPTPECTLTIGVNGSEPSNNNPIDLSFDSWNAARIQIKVNASGPQGSTVTVEQVESGTFQSGHVKIEKIVNLTDDLDADNRFSGGFEINASERNGGEGGDILVYQFEAVCTAGGKTRKVRKVAVIHLHKQ